MNLSCHIPDQHQPLRISRSADPVEIGSGNDMWKWFRFWFPHDCYYSTPCLSEEDTRKMFVRWLVVKTTQWFISDMLRAISSVNHLFFGGRDKQKKKGEKKGIAFLTRRYFPTPFCHLSSATHSFFILSRRLFFFFLCRIFTLVRPECPGGSSLHPKFSLFFSQLLPDSVLLGAVYRISSLSHVPSVLIFLTQWWHVTRIPAG